MIEHAMTIGKVANRAGVTREAIRFYEREGLLPKPKRNGSGYRLYDPAILGRLRFIQQARYLGLSLDEIHEIVGMAQAGRTPCRRVRELLSGKLEELDRKIGDLVRFRRDLARFIKKIARMPDQADTSQSICVLIDLAAQMGRNLHVQRKAAGQRCVSSRAR